MEQLSKEDLEMLKWLEEADDKEITKAMEDVDKEYFNF